MNEFARIRNLTSSSSPWVGKIKSEKIWLCEYVGKLKGIGNQGEVKMNEINVHTIVDFQRHVHKFGLIYELIAWSTHMIEHTFVNWQWCEC